MKRRRLRQVSKPFVKAKRVRVDDHTFDSISEGRRYADLKLLVAAKEVRNLEVHPKLSLRVNGRKIGRGYLVLDFKYEEWRDAAWRTVYEDFKAVDTRESKLRRQLAEAIHGINIKVTQPWR